MHIENLNTILQDQRTIALSAVFPDSLYAVGGAPRDAILGREIKDIDFTVPVPPEEIIKQCEAHNYRVIPTGLSHQTVSIICVEGLPPVEITSFRTGNMNPDGGVFLGKNIEEDLSFRDFTCNAIAIHIASKNIIDPTHGRDAIEKKELRSVGSADARFKEDPLRILRMVRHSVELDFTIEEKTLQSAHKNFSLLEKTAIERIREEFSKIIVSKHAAEGLEQLRLLGFYKKYIPELEKCVDFEQNKFHHKDVFQHSLDVVSLSENSLLSRLSALFHDIGKPPSLSVDEEGERHFYLHEKIGADMVPDILKRLSYPKHIQQGVKILTYMHMRPLNAGNAGLKRIIRDTEPYYVEWRNLKEADTIAVLGNTPEVIQDFQNFDRRILDIIQSEKESNYKNIAVNGNDLIELGIKKGPIYKDILKFCEELVIEDAEKNNKETLIKEIRQNFKSYLKQN